MSRIYVLYSIAPLSNVTENKSYPTLKEAVEGAKYYAMQHKLKFMVLGHYHVKARLFGLIGDTYNMEALAEIDKDGNMRKLDAAKHIDM